MNNAYIGHASNQGIRYAATSGGIGSALLRYLFETDKIQTAVSFNFDKTTLQYFPKFIHSYDDYKIIGSIYHEIDLVKFIRDNIDNIKGNFACFALPCQVRQIQHICKSNNIPCFVFGLTCSSQQRIEATYYLCKRLNVNRQDIHSIQYRGNGWPSGIEIVKNDGEAINIPNNNSIWTQIFHSRLFIYKRCFYCTNTLNDFADVSLADPWLKENIENDKIGSTLIVLRTEYAQKVCNEAKKAKYIDLKKINENLITQSQHSTIVRKKSYKKHRKIIKLISSFWLSKKYIQFVTSNRLLFDLHCFIKEYIEKAIIIV
jgi:coenzyme F420-reducing hydrogenase beta subunit